MEDGVALRPDPLLLLFEPDSSTRLKMPFVQIIEVIEVVLILFSF